MGVPARESSPAARVVVVQGRRQGTGVLLSPRYVLTCAHIVAQGRVTQIVHPETGRIVPCEVLWAGDTSRTDAALLRAHSDVAAPLGRLRWARLSRDDALPGCQTLGFSGHQRYDGSRLDFGQYTGTVLPVAGRIRGVLTFHLDHSPGGVGPGNRSPLAGLSGSPVFAGPVLLGIVSNVRETDGHQHLEAVSVEALELPLRATLLGRDGGREILPPLEPLSGMHPQDGAYEQRYASALKAQYRKTEIFGIDELGVSEASWDLDTAYVSLQATGPDADDRSDYGGSDYGGSVGGSGSGVDSPPRRVEDLLGRSRRILLRGEAGAGKTTLVWWLAAHAACGTLPTGLDELNGLIPFVVPLRGLRSRGRGFPGPDELARIAELPVGHAPDGWAERVLESGRALILVDGLDELPQADRPKARAWLTSLLRGHGNSRALATVRPGAVESDWLATEGFTELLLLPMNDDDIGAFVTAWHRAARLEFAALADPVRNEAEAQRLRFLEHKLSQEFTRNRVLRDLARTPLLCAVICALHRKRVSRLPDTRWELYRATLDMLLGKRDTQRGIDAPDGLTISTEEHKLLLQHIAVWLVRGGQTQLTPEQAITQIEKAVRGMPQIRAQGSPARILTHLLNRSGLLQQRGEHTVQFIHRTFQDYLAAKEFAETDSVDELVKNADDEQWQDVVRLSVGHFNRGQVSTLIARLIERADVVGPEYDTLHLLAGQCAGSSVYVDEDVRAKLERRIRDLLPATDADAIHQVATLGPYVLPLLPGPSGEEFADLSVIETIAQVGDESGIDRLVEFGDSANIAVRRALVALWRTFPVERYAEEVLSRSWLNDFTVRLHTAAQLRQLHRLPQVTSLALHDDHTSGELDALLPSTGLTGLSLHNNAKVTTLGFVANRPSISRLTLRGCPGVTSFEELSGRALEWLSLGSRLLALRGPRPRVHTLQLGGSAARIQYEDLVRWDSVEALDILAGRFPSLVVAARHMPSVRRLSVAELGTHELDRAYPLPNVTELVLDSVRRDLDMAVLARVFPSLRRLSLGFGGAGEYHLDLRPLKDLPELTVDVRHLARTVLRLTGGEHFEGRLTTGSPD
ncbi:NACHT domain-containing protein [Streptomyces sp. NPDC055078]